VIEAKILENQNEKTAKIKQRVTLSDGTSTLVAMVSQ